jgi:hypothetical protein
MRPGRYLHGLLPPPPQPGAVIDDVDHVGERSVVELQSDLADAGLRVSGSAGQVEDVRPAGLGSDRRREAVDGQHVGHGAVEEDIHGRLLFERACRPVLV